MPVPETPGVLSVILSHGSKAHRVRTPVQLQLPTGITLLPGHVSHPRTSTKGPGWVLYWRSGGFGRGWAPSAKSRASGTLTADRNRTRVISVCYRVRFVGSSCFHQDDKKPDLVFCGFSWFLLRETLFPLSPAVTHGVEGDIKGNQKAWGRKLWFPNFPLASLLRIMLQLQLSAPAVQHLACAFLSHTYVIPSSLTSGGPWSFRI